MRPALRTSRQLFVPETSYKDLLYGISDDYRRDRVHCRAAAVSAGLSSGVAQRGAVPFVGHTASGQMTSDPASGLVNQAAAGATEETYFGTPLYDLCKEEPWKHAEDPLDIWDKLLSHANEDKAPAPDDLFRFKFNGLFYVAPAQDSFMLRLRVPGAVLSARQLRGTTLSSTSRSPGGRACCTRGSTISLPRAPRRLLRHRPWHP